MMPSSKKQSWLVLPVRQFAQTCVEIKFRAPHATLSPWQCRLDGVERNLTH